MSETRTRSASKSIIWRILGVLILAAVTYAYTRKWIQTGLITVIHHGVFLFVFYFHERLWLKVKRIQNLMTRSILKMLTYETLCGNVILGTISYLVTGSWKQMTAITLTYIGIKHVCYIFNEFAWDKIKGGFEMIIVYAYVCGDILHKGHIEHLKNAKALGDKLIVGVLTDAAVMEKKPKPVMGFDERFDLVSSLKWVDVAVAQHTYSPLENVMALKPDILVEATDHKEQPANAFMESIGGRVFAMPYYPDHSSMEVKSKVKKDDCLRK